MSTGAPTPDGDDPPRPTVGDLLREHPELAPPAPPPPTPAETRRDRRNAWIGFPLLLLVALAGAAGAAYVASGAAIVGSGLGGQRVTLVDVGGLRGTTGRIAAPGQLAGHSVSVVGGDHGDGTYYLWPHGSGLAYERGWGFLVGEWIPLVLMVLCLMAAGVIVKALGRLARHEEV